MEADTAAACAGGAEIGSLDARQVEIGPEALAWRATKRAALDAWRAAMTPAEAAAYEAAKITLAAEKGLRRAARAARAAEREAFDRRVIVGVLAGRSTDEIAAGVGAPARDVRRICQRLGVERARPGFRRVPLAQVPAAICAQVEAVAAERGASASETIAALIVVAFEDGAFHARRLLRMTSMR